MPLKHAVLFGTTALLFVLGISLGFTGTQSEAVESTPVACGSLLAPDTAAAAFKHDVMVGGADELADDYARACEQVLATRQVPTYSALGLGVLGLFVSSMVLGCGRCIAIEPL